MADGGTLSPRLSPMDAAFLFFERPEQRLHVGCVALLESAVSYEAFVAAVEERLLGPGSRYRQRATRRPLDLDLPRWEDEARFEVRRHVRHLGVPAPGDSGSLHQLIDSVFGARLDPAHPLWEIHLIDGLADGRAAVLCKVHHSMIDGVSGAQLLGALADPVPSVQQSLLPSAVGASAGSPWGPAAFWDAVRDAGEALTLARSLFTRPAPNSPFNGVLSDARRVAWSSFALHDLLALRGAVGGTMNDVVLALITGAFRAAFRERGVRPPAGGLRALTPVSTRREDQRLQMGNLVAAMFPMLPVDCADPVERIRRIVAETRDLKARGQARAVGRTMSLMNLLPTPFTSAFGRLVPESFIVNTVCTNVPGPRERRTLLGAPIAEVHPIAPLFFGMGIEFAILSYADRLSISAVADPHLVPEIDQFPRWLQEAAVELTQALRIGEAPAAASATPASTGAVVRVADVMSHPVATVLPNATLAAVSQLMAGRRLRHVPVVSPDGRIQGLITQRDLLSLQPSTLDLPDERDRLALLGRVSAHEVMETHLAVIGPDDPASAAGEQLRRHKIGCLPVVDAGGHVVGIITRSDFLRWATEQLGAPVDAARIPVAS